VVINKDIQKYLKQKYGFFAKNTWIAHAKEVYGLPTKNRHLEKATKENGPVHQRDLDISKKLLFILDC